MKIEIILLLVIGLIFFIDTLMRGIKKKTSSSEVDIKKENFQDFKYTDNGSVASAKIKHQVLN